MRKADGWIFVWAATAVLFIAPACGGGSGGGVNPEPDTVADAPAVDVSAEDTPVVDAPMDVSTEDLPTPDVVPDTMEDTGEPDIVEPPEPHPFFDYVGEVRLDQSNDPDGAFLSAGGKAIFWTGPNGFNQHMLMEEEGACQFWVMALPPFCEPVCAPGAEWCGQDGVCHPAPARISAGEITFSGLLQGISAVPDDSAWYNFQGLDNGAPIFEAGAPITVSASGDEIPAFEVEIEGVGSIVIPSPSYEFEDGQDNVFTWEPQGDGATVEVAFLVGWHGAPPPVMIWCSAPEEDGSIVVPQHMVEMFPSAGCMGLFPHAPWVRRVNRSIMDTDAGPVEITTMATKTFNLKHGECF